MAVEQFFNFDCGDKAGLNFQLTLSGAARAWLYMKIFQLSPDSK